MRLLSKDISWDDEIIRCRVPLFPNALISSSSGHAWMNTSLRREVTRYPKKQEGADSRQHLPPGVQRCSAREARLQLPESRGPSRTAGLRAGFSSGA
jgi:hypothetical protein